MTGDTFVRYLQAYCDGELDASKVPDVEGHLEACPACRQTVEAERTFRDVLRDKLPPEPVPSHVEQQLRSALAEQDQERTRAAPLPVWGRRPWAVALAASVVLIAVGGILGYLVARPRLGAGVPPMAAELVSEHMKFALLENPAELSSNSTQHVALWVQDRIGQPVRVPDYSPNGITLLGGRVIRVGGRRAGTIVYEKGRNIISLFAFPRYGADFSGLQEVRREGRILRAGEYRGQQILLWENGETGYALVSDVGWDELYQCARVFFETRES